MSSFLEGLYRHYTNGTDEMECVQFIKLVQDCRLLEEKKFTKADVSTIFAKSAKPETKKIDFIRFKENFSEFAMKKGISKNEIVKRFEARGKVILLDNESCGLSYSVVLSRTDISTMTDVSGSPKSLSESQNTIESL